MVQKTKVSLTNPKVQAILESLNELISDQNTPQAIRASAMQVTQVFSNGGGSIEQRKSMALQILEEIIYDSTLDVCTRTTLFSTMSLVESLSEA